MSDRNFGLLAMIGSPFLFIKLAIGEFNFHTPAYFSGICDFIYISAFLCAILSKRKISSYSYSEFQKIIQACEISILLFAGTCCAFEMIKPISKLYSLLAFCWALICLLITIQGLFTNRNVIHESSRKYVSLFAGIWLLFSILDFSLLQSNPVLLPYEGIFSMLTCALLGYIHFTTKLPDIISDNMLYERSTL